MKTLYNISKIGIILIILMSSISGFSQNTNESPTIFNYAEWSGTDLDALYDNCIIALHLNDMEIDLAKTKDGKEMKLIYTESISRRFLGYARISFSLNLLIFKISDNKVAIHINIKNPTIVSESSVPVRQTEAVLCTKEIARIMEELFYQIENRQDKPISTKKTGITIKY
jgi:hypothetical protein